MSFLLNPYTYQSGFVRDGLVLNLDASDPNSYPGTGSIWYDTSGNGKDFSLSGFSWNSSGYFNVSSGSGATGPASNSFGFSNESYIEVVAMPDANRTSTFFGWYNGSTRTIQVHLPWSDGVLYYDAGGCCNPDTRVFVGSQVNLGQIKHYSFITRRSTTPNREVYKNNTSIVNSGGNSTPAYAFNTQPSVLAQTWSGRFYSIRAYNRALTQEERTTNWEYDQKRFSIT